MPGSLALAEKYSPEVRTADAVNLAEQRYGRSNSAFIAFGGRQALKQEVVVENIEQTSDLEALAVKSDFSAGVTEMLSTDPDSRDKLHIEELNILKKVGQKIYSEDGRDMIQLVKNGAKKSAELAQTHKEYESIAQRDEGDDIVMEVVANLKPGQTHITGSLAPIKAQKLFPKFMKGLGFDDVTYLQYYSMQEDGSVAAGLISVKQTDLGAWIKTMKKHTADIPEDVDYDTFIRYGITLDMDPDEALQKVKQIRQDYYDEIGADYGEIVSVNEFVVNHQDIVDAIFAEYYPALSQAAFSGDNNQVLKQYAKDVLASRDLAKLKEEIKRDLIKIANSNKFGGDLAQTMDLMFRYAAVEILRTELPKFLNPNSRARFEGRVAARAISSTNPGSQASVNYVNLNQHMINHTSAGVQNNREYGGCPGNSSMTDESELTSSTLGIDQQMTYGGLGRLGRFGSRDRYGLRSFRCPKGHLNERPKDKLIPNCKVCGTDVACDPSKKKSTKKYKTMYSNDLNGFGVGFFDNSTSKEKVKFSMAS